MSATSQGRYSDQTSERYSDPSSARPRDAEGREQRVEGRGQRVEIPGSESLRDSLPSEEWSTRAVIGLELKTDPQPQTARAPGDRLASLAEIAESINFDAPNQRHQVIRTGERERIPGPVRLAVWLRDRGICSMCADRRDHISQWEMDHIIPWSDGGSDDSTNLRVLCVQHNQERSNYGDIDETPRRPVTWWCSNCVGEYEPIRLERKELFEPQEGVYRETLVCPIHGRCRVSNAANRTGEASWFSRGPMYLWLATTVAYCAHCDRIGYTDRPL